MSRYKRGIDQAVGNIHSSLFTRCPHSPTVLDINKVCDGTKHCDYGEDEVGYHQFGLILVPDWLIGCFLLLTMYHRCGVVTSLG